MQKIITKKNGRYKVSFAHWSKSQRNLLGIILVSGIFYLGWLAWKDQPLPYLFKIVIWDNFPYILLALVIVSLIARFSNRKKEKDSAKR